VGGEGEKSSSMMEFIGRVSSIDDVMIDAGFRV
jgi:hypothetical protein